MSVVSPNVPKQTQQPSGALAPSKRETLRTGQTNQPTFPRLADDAAVPVPVRGREFLKRALDLVLAVIVLVLATPIVFLLAIVVRCTSRGPAIYRQTRLGWNDRPFTLYKLRTMEHDCERLTGPCWAVPNDPRITLVGRFLRGLHLDELPQVWNILRGDMSFIGPRPERPEIIDRLEQTIPKYAVRRQVRPGLTGLAQLQLPPDVSIACVRRKLVYDLHYIEEASLWLDLRILAATALKLMGLSCQVMHPIAVVVNPCAERVAPRRAPC